MTTDFQQLVREVAADVAEILGNGWKVEVTEGNHWPGIVNGDGATVRFREAWSAKGRITIDGLFHQPRPGAWYRGTDHHITVAANKPVQKIARDVERRLLPGYLPDHKEWVERCEAEAKSIAEAREFRETLGLVLGVAIHEWNHEREHIYGDGQADWRVPDFGHVTVEFRSLDYEQARKLAEFSRGL